LEEKYNSNSYFSPLGRKIQRIFSSGFLKIVYKENFKRKGRGRRGNLGFPTPYSRWAIHPLYDL
jgi:hypothetical protein